MFRTIGEASARRAAAGAMAHGAGSPRVMGVHEWTAPYGALTGAPFFFALHAQRHFHDYGTTPEHLGRIALNARANAMRNPEAIYRTALTMDDYLASRMISSPLRMLDCDVPVDGSVAIIVSRMDQARDLCQPPLRIEAIGSALHARDTWFRSEDLTQTGAVDAARMMWSRTDLGPADVDTAQLYDGFSILTLLWLEALGFCGRGEGGGYIDEGRRIALDGELPVNTGGGQLSAGRLHGLGHLHEACLQLWGGGR
ncbi:thiolase family protein [Novosphingobium colocasiae]